MTQETSSTTNPIRLRFIGTDRSNDRAAIDVFKSQIPGTVVLDTASRYFRCTHYTTSIGEPIWAEINIGGANLENYSIYVNYTSNAKGIESSKTTYKDPGLIARRKKEKAFKVQVGFYFFQKLSSNELARIKNSHSYDASTFVSTRETSDIYDQGNISAGAARAIQEKYDYMSYDSNGRSGPGGGQSGMTEAQTIAAYGSWYGAGNVTTAPSSGTGSGTGTGTGAGAGTGKEKSSSNKNTKSGKSKNATGGQSGIAKTVVTLKPDKKIYTGNNDFSLPYMKQFVNHFNTAESSRQRIERIHVFEMIPNSFEFSQLSSTWNEVERSGNYPLVDWSNYNLTKVSFRFLVVAKKLETNEFYKIDPVTKAKTLIKQTSSIVNDGLLASIDDQLDNIRAMVGAPAPITLYNVNTLLSTEYRYPYTNNTRNMQWIINDCSVTATRFTDNGNAISAAEVSLTLTEYPVIAREIIPLPPLTPDNPPPPPCKPDSGDPKCTPADPTYGLWVANTYKYLAYAKDTLAYPAGKDN